MKYSQFQKIISMLLTCVILVHLTGCYSLKPISTAEISISKNKNCVINSHGSKYFATITEIAKDTLYCKISEDLFTDYVAKTYIYLLPDSSLNIYNDKNISLPLASIDKVKISKFNAFSTTFLLGAGTIILFLILLNSIEIHNSLFL
jgi:hypothetical protein